MQQRQGAVWFTELGPVVRFPFFTASASNLAVKSPRLSKQPREKMMLQEALPFPSSLCMGPNHAFEVQFYFHWLSRKPRAGMQPHLQAAHVLRSIKLSLSACPGLCIPLSPERALLTVAFSDRYQSGMGMWWFGTFLLLFFWSSDSQSKEFKSGKLLLMSMPSWVHRPKDQPPNSEPLGKKKKKKGHSEHDNLWSPRKEFGDAANVIPYREIERQIRSLTDFFFFLFHVKPWMR